MRKEIFTEYYKNNTWQGKESLSGPGSDFEQTKFLIPELNILLKELKIKTMLDAPCGDFNWMRKVNLSGINYLGADIVDELINKNNRKYKKDNISFSVIDIVNDSIPKVDLIMVRDCFVHLPNQDIKKALKNIKESGSKFLLTTNFFWKNMSCNADIQVGEWRRINLTLDPFNFKYPEQVLIEGNIQSHDRDKTLSLWNIKDIPNYKEYSG